MADLSVTIGLDQSELEKGLANAGKSLGKLSGAVQAGQNPFQARANQLSTGMGIGTMLGGPIGGVIGAFFDAFGGMLSAALAKVKEIADYAKSIRLASITSGLSISQVRNLEAIGQVFGVSLQAMVSSTTEFTRRMGEARIKGGELTNILAKMGIGMDEVANGTFNHQKAMMALADAYAAGTDEATLLYYGTKMFGDSFKDLLPIIKAGSKAVQDAAHTYYKAYDEQTSAASRLGDLMTNVGRSFTNFLIDIVGGFHMFMEDMAEGIDNFFDSGAWDPTETPEEKAARHLRNAPKGLTNDELRKRYLSPEALELYLNDPEERERYRKEMEKRLKGNGKVLTPFGMAEAGAASQMQQMGGGDIFGAVAFTPLERIATATEATAEHTRPKDAPAVRTPDELSR
jgi:hypothetical protein